MTPAEHITRHFSGDWHGTYGRFAAPGHSASDRGMKVEDVPGAPDDVLIHSFNNADALAVKDDCRRLGLLPQRNEGGEHWRVTGVYEFRDEAGNAIYRTRRHEHPHKPKKFDAQRFENGRWEPGLETSRRVLYRLPELLAAGLSEPVYFVEGERKADKLSDMGFTATSNAFGCGGWSNKYREIYVEPLKGRTVIILPDNDEPGRDFAKRVGTDINAAGGRAVIVELPGLPLKGDIMDWTGTAAELRALAAAACDSDEDAVNEEWSPINEDQQGNQPVIRIEAGKYHTIANEAERALIEAKAPLYVRGGIVRPIVDTVPAAHGRQTKTARLAEVTADVLLDLLSRSATWIRFNVRAQADVLADPPRVIAQILLSRDGAWKFPRLTAITTCPTLRPDGTIHGEAGFDPETGLLLLDPPKLPQIPGEPTKVEALSALDLLDGLLDGFQFANAASRSVALSALITPVVRGVMQTSPLHAASAPVAGSGKSYLFDVVSAIATGERAPVIAAGRTEEETEKRLGAALLSGRPIVAIDNVNGKLGGDALCQLIERPVVAVRPLGVSKLVRVESRATVFATGNNIQLVGDMTRRVIVCRLDPEMERPELREFDDKPFDTVIADRGRYIAAALTVVRAYIVAGYPEMLPELASFGAWSNCVRSALVWLGHPDPVQTMEMARDDDPDNAALRPLMASWHAAVGQEPMTTGQIRTLAETLNPLGNAIHPELQAALIEVAEGRGGRIDAKRLGHFLVRHNGRIIDGRKMKGREDAHLKQKLWSVSPV